MSYQELFTPFKIGSMRVKNRIVMSPMGTNSASAFVLTGVLLVKRRNQKEQ